MADNSDNNKRPILLPVVLSVLTTILCRVIFEKIGL